MTRRASVLCFTFILALSSGACSAAPAEPPVTADLAPEMVQVLVDVSDSSPVSAPRATEVVRRAVEWASDQPSPVTIQVWLSGQSLEECRLAWESTTTPPRSGTARMRATRRQRQIDSATGAVQAIVTGALAVRTTASPLFELLAKAVRAVPPGAAVRIYYLTDMKPATKGLDCECRTPADADVARYLKTNGLLQPDRAYRQVEELRFAYVDLSTVNPRCPGETLREEQRREDMWRGALAAAGVAPGAIEVLAGPPDLTRGPQRRKKPRRGRRWTTTVLRLRDRFGREITLDTMPPPRPGVSLHDYIVSIIGPRPTYDPTTNPRQEKAVQDAATKPAVDAHGRTVEGLKEQRTNWAPGWLLIAVIVVLAVVEIAATRTLLRELGVDPVTSWLWAVGFVAATIWALEHLARKAKRGFWFVVGYAAVLVVMVALAVLRAGDLAADGSESVATDISTVIVMTALVAGIPYALSVALGAYFEQAPLARRIRIAKRKLHEMHRVCSSGQASVESDREAVIAYDALYEHVKAMALAAYPTRFTDPTAPLGGAVAEKGDDENGNS